MTANGWSAADAVGPNEYYTGSRLTYQRARDVETELVDWASGRRARGILLRAIVGGFLIWLLLYTPAAFLEAYSLSQGNLEVSGTARLLAVLPNLAAPAWFFLVLFLPRTETLSEWQLLLDQKAQLAPVAYGVIHQVLRERRLPAYIDPVQRKVNFPETAVRSFLRVSLSRYEVIISVFPFGRDLYMGWTMRRREIPIKIVGRWLRSLLGSGVNFSDLIDLEPVRAMREAVHNAMRAGIEAAAQAAVPRPAFLGEGGHAQHAYRS